MCWLLHRGIYRFQTEKGVDAMKLTVCISRHNNYPIIPLTDPDSSIQWLASVAVSIQMFGDIILMLALIYVFRKSRTGIGKYVLPPALYVMLIHR